MNRLYELCSLFCDNIWGGILRVEQVLDYTYNIKNDNEKIFTNFVLYKSEIKSTNMLLQLEEHLSKKEKFYVVKFYTTNEEKLDDLLGWRSSTLFDKILSMVIYADKVKLVYSENYFAPEILQISEELYNYIHSYLDVRRGLKEQQLQEESKKLSEM